MQKINYTKLLKQNYPNTFYQKLATLYEYKGRLEVYLETERANFVQMEKKAWNELKAFHDMLNANEKKKEKVDYMGAVDWIKLNYQIDSFNQHSLNEIYRQLSLKKSISYRDIDRRIFYRNRLKNERKRVYDSRVRGNEIEIKLNQMFVAYQNAVEEKVAPMLLIPAVIVDLYCIEPYFDHHKEIILLIIRFLLLTYDFKIVNYINLEQFITKDEITYEEALEKSGKWWPDYRHNPGYFAEYLLDILCQSYQLFEQQFHLEDKQTISATQQVLNAIDFSNGSLSKRQIMEICSNLSQKTVERAIHRLLKEGNIKSLGKGNKIRYRVNQ